MSMGIEGYHINQDEKILDPLSRMADAASWPGRIDEVLSGVPDNQDYRSIVIDAAIANSGETFSGNAGLLAEALEPLRTREFADREEFKAALIEGMHRFLHDHWTAESYADMLRSNLVTANNEKITWLSKLLHCDISGDEINLHLAPGKDLYPIRAYLDVKRGFKALEDKILSDPIYSAAKKIVAESWIIAENPDILIKAGFTIDGDVTEEYRKKHPEEKRTVWRAHVSVADFLENMNKSLYEP